MCIDIIGTSLIEIFSFALGAVLVYIIGKFKIPILKIKNRITGKDLINIELIIKFPIIPSYNEEEVRKLKRKYIIHDKELKFEIDKINDDHIENPDDETSECGSSESDVYLRAYYNCERVYIKNFKNLISKTKDTINEVAFEFADSKPSITIKIQMSNVSQKKYIGGIKVNNMQLKYENPNLKMDITSNSIYVASTDLKTEDVDRISDTILYILAVNNKKS